MLNCASCDSEVEVTDGKVGTGDFADIFYCTRCWTLWEDDLRIMKEQALRDMYVRTCPCQLVVGTHVMLRDMSAPGFNGLRAVLKDPYFSLDHVLVSLYRAGEVAPVDFEVHPKNLERCQWRSEFGVASAKVYEHSGKKHSTYFQDDWAEHTFRSVLVQHWRMAAGKCKKASNGVPSILDLGCGMGNNSQSLAGELHSNVVGIDLRTDISEVLELPEHGTVQLVCPCDMLSVCDQVMIDSFGWRRYFDIVCSFAAAQHLTKCELSQLLHRLHYCVKPGAFLALMVPSILTETTSVTAAGALSTPNSFLHVERYSVDELIALLEAAGWEMVLSSVIAGSEEQWVQVLATSPCDMSRGGNAIDAVMRCHLRTSHESPQKMAVTGEKKDFDFFPDVFLNFRGTAIIDLSSDAMQGWLSETLRHGLGITAWRDMDNGGLRCCLRANPSSGSRHPLEAYVLGDSGTVPGWSGNGALFHYNPLWNVLEVLCELPVPLWEIISAQLLPGAVLVALTVFFWRTVWKYVEVSFQAVQRDTGHAIASLGFAALTAGANVTVVESVSDSTLAGLLGLRQDSVAGDQQAQALLMVNPITEKSWPGKLRIPQHLLPIPWNNSGTCSGPLPPVVCDAQYVTSKQSILDHFPGCDLTTTSLMTSGLPWKLCDISASLWKRRSALSFERGGTISASSLFDLLYACMPSAQPLLGMFPLASPLVPMLVIMIHRVDEMEKGLYVLVRDPHRLQQLRSCFPSQYLWESVQYASSCGRSLPLYLLARGDFDHGARTSVLWQTAEDGPACSLAMLVELELTLERYGAWIYRRLFWEAGAIGQALYIGAECSGLISCGFGAFFGQWFHDYIGVDSSRLCDVYHFAIGTVTDRDYDGAEPVHLQRAAYCHLDRFRYLDARMKARDCMDMKLAQWGIFQDLTND